MFPSSAVVPEHSYNIQRDTSMEAAYSKETATPPMPRTPPDAFEKQTFAIAQDDLAVLDILTGNISNHGHGDIDSRTHTLAVEGNPATNDTKRNTKFARRDADLDPLLIAAAFASGPHVTRHHYHHNFNPAEDWTRWGSDGGDSSTDAEDNVSKNRPKYISRQAPRSERIRLLREQQRTLAVERTPSLSPDLPPSDPFESHSDDSEDDKSSIPSLSLSTPETATSSLLSSPALVPLQLKPEALSLVTSFPQLNTSSEVQVKCMVRTRVPTPHGEVFLHLYHNNRDNKEHLAIVFDPAQLKYEGTATDADNGLHAPFIRSKTLDAVWSESETPMERIIRGAYVGRLNEHRCVVSKPEDVNVATTQQADSDSKSDLNLAALVPPPLVRIHSECFTGETIGSMRCDCGEQLDEAIRRIAEPTTVYVPASTDKPAQTHTIPGRGAVIYMRQEGRGIGLLSKLRAYNLQDLGHDTVAANLLLGFGADERGYDVAAAIMRDLGLDDGVRLLTNNPEKVNAMEKEGIVVRERVEMVPRSWRWKCQSEDVDETNSVDEAGLSRPRLHSNMNSSYSGHVHAHEDTNYDDERNARLRAAGATLIGASATHGPELEKYLRTKVLRMGHMLSLPTS